MALPYARQPIHHYDYPFHSQNLATSSNDVTVTKFLQDSVAHNLEQVADDISVTKFLG